MIGISICFVILIAILINVGKHNITIAGGCQLRCYRIRSIIANHLTAGILHRRRHLASYRVRIFNIRIAVHGGIRMSRSRDGNIIRNEYSHSTAGTAGTNAILIFYNIWISVSTAFRRHGHPIVFRVGVRWIVMVLSICVAMVEGPGQRISIGIYIGDLCT